MVGSNKNKLLLIDGHSLAYRAYYALMVDNFRTSTGQATNALYGFFTMLTNLYSQEDPAYLAVAFDEQRPVFRTNLYPDYKAQRKPTPDDFKSQIPLIKQMLEVIGVPWLSNADYEADDVIATLATQAEDLEVVIVTGDRDSFQLIQNNIYILYPKKGVSEYDLYTNEKLLEKYGITASQYIDYAALRGDNSDNLPGVPGVGEKTAAKWISDYGSLEGLISHLADVKGKVGEALRANIEQVKLNKQLTTMVKDVPLNKKISELVRTDFHLDKFHELSNILELRSLKTRLLAAFNQSATEASTVSKSKSFKHMEVDLTELATILTKWSSSVAANQPILLDVLFKDEDNVSISHVILGLEAEFVSVKISSTNYQSMLNEWVNLLNKSNLLFVGHSLKPALRELFAQQIPTFGIFFDTELAAYLLNPAQRNYALPELISQYLHTEIDSNSSAIATEQQLELLADLTTDKTSLLETRIQVLSYFSELYELLFNRLQQLEQLSLLQDMDIPTMYVLAKMEAAGIKVDKAALTSLMYEFNQEAEVCRQKALDLVGYEVNLSSPKQLQEVLFSHFNMPKTKKTKTGYTTDANALNELYKKTEHPFLQELLEFREKIKLKQVVETLLKFVASGDRIHSTFMQTVASTGRLSSIDPNLQNIPVRSTAGKKIRDTFIPSFSDTIFVTADYSQIEMRIMAHLSGDQSLIDAFNAGEDLHNYVGSVVFGVPKDEVTAELRRRVKAISYGLAYGLSAYGLAKQLDISNKEAQIHMDAYFARFGKVKDYLAEVVEQAKQVGFTETLYGRRRYLPELNSSNPTIRQIAERAALNAPIQGSSADIIKMAMINIDQKLAANKLRSRLLLQIHDELVFEAYVDELAILKKVIEHEMSSVIKLSVPLEVSVGEGKTWQQAAH